jgi:hypothetical protein
MCVGSGCSGRTEVAFNKCTITGSLGLSVVVVWVVVVVIGFCVVGGVTEWASGALDECSVVVVGSNEGVGVVFGTSVVDEVTGCSVTTSLG